MAGKSGSGNRYHGLSINLHWLMLLLIAATYACIELRDNTLTRMLPRRR